VNSVSLTISPVARFSVTATDAAGNISTAGTFRTLDHN
jgi:hypothetical protein